jgi:hypothetical protein
MTKNSYKVIYNFLSTEEINALLKYWNSISETKHIKTNNWDTKNKIISYLYKVSLRPCNSN